MIQASAVRKDIKDTGLKRNKKMEWYFTPHTKSFQVV